MAAIQHKSSDPLARSRVQSGYNHKFNYRGKIFHVQTEDYGAPRCFICSHIFVDGQVVESAKSSYPSDWNAEERAEEIRDLVMGSHRKMFVRIKDGEFDRFVEDQPKAQPPAQTLVPSANDEAAPAPKPRPRSFSRNVIEDDAVPREDFQRVELGPQGEAIIESICTELEGMLALAYVCPSNQTYFALRDSGINPNPGLKAIVDLAHAQLTCMQKLGFDSMDFQLNAQTPQHFLMVLPVSATAMLYLVFDRPRTNIALVQHKLLPMVASLGSLSHS